MRHSLVIKYGCLVLRQLEEKDIEKLRQWRNETSKTRFLRNVGFISAESQIDWFKRYLENNDEACFAIEEVGAINGLIGSVSIYDFKGDQSNFGKIMIGDERAHGKGFGRIAMVMALKAAFEVFKLKKIVAEVHQDNIAAKKNDLKIGFSIIGQKQSQVGGYEDIIEISREKCIEFNPYYGDISVGGTIQ